MTIMSLWRMVQLLKNISGSALTYKISYFRKQSCVSLLETCEKRLTSVATDVILKPKQPKNNNILLTSSLDLSVGSLL